MDAKKILIVIDMQKDFIDGSLGTPEAQAIVENMVSLIDGFDGEVLYTLDTHFENYMDTLEGKKLPVMHCIRGTEGWQEEPRVLAALERKNAKCFEKPTFGSYELVDYVYDAVCGGNAALEGSVGRNGSDNASVNRSAGETVGQTGDAVSAARLTGGKSDAAAAAEITLAGLCTDICVASNAILLRAKLPNTVIRVKADCCAGVTPASHQAALTTLAMCQMDII